MNALWIIDLSESENAIKAFFDSFWDVYLQNQKDPEYPENYRSPWYYISTIEDLGLRMENNDQKTDLRPLLEERLLATANNLIDQTDGMIKYPFPLNDYGKVKRLSVVIVGDIESKTTHRFFQPIANSLRENGKTAAGWSRGIANVYYYGLLYRRSEVVRGNNLSPDEKAFLNQLHNTQNALDTFDHVLFLEKPKAKKEEAVKSMALATLHLAFEEANDDRVLKTYSDYDNVPVFINTGASGIFFEREVQNDREAFLLGHTLLEPFVNSTETEFYNRDAATERAENISTFRNHELDEMNLYGRLSARMPSLDISQFEFPMPVKPGSLKVREVWKRYFGSKESYIANLKANLVNKVRLELSIYEHDCLERISENQLEWIKKQSAAVEDGIFGIFDDEHPDTYCSMHQAIEVAKQAEILAAKRIVDKAEGISLDAGEGLPPQPIPIPERYEKAYETAALNNEDVSEQDVLDALDHKLRRHPVFMFSMFSRALLLSIILGAFFIFYQPIVAVALFAVPIVAYFLVYRRYMNVLKSLQDRYVGVSLHKLNEKLILQYKKAIHKSQTDIRDYCKWNYEERLAMLRNNLGVFVPKEFHFKPFEDFQPLLVDNLRIETFDKVKKVGRNEGEAEEAPSMSSGKFDNIPLLKDVPNFRVNLGGGTQKSVMRLTSSDKMHFIHRLMKQTAFVPEQMEEDLDPAQMILKNAGSAVLMLDVSGSMFGQPHEDLKAAVKTLKEEFKDQIRWVAFANVAFLDKDPTINEDLDKAQAVCGGGTLYVPAFELLKKAYEKGEIELGKLIIVSDGCPADAEESRRKILELGCPVDVIYIGGGSEGYLRELAESTGGTLQQVQDVKNAQIQTVVEDGIKTRFKLANEGNFPFGDLLRKSAIKPSMKALLVFTKSVMVTNNLCIETMIADYGDDAGLQNWLVDHVKMCSLNEEVANMMIDIHIKSSGIIQNGINQQDNMCQRLIDATRHAELQFTGEFKERFKMVIPIAFAADIAYRPDSPDILVTQLHIQPLSGIKDLGWTFDPNNDLQINNEAGFDELFKSYFAQGYQFVNIYNQPIA